MARLRIRLSRGHRHLLLQVSVGVLGAVGTLRVLALWLGPIASWVGGSTVEQLRGKEKADAINAVRQTLLQAGAGSVASFLLLFTALTYLMNLRGQVTDRYAKAVGMIASDKVGERIGGIYALEHVMIESERDHETVVQVLTALIREHAPAPTTTDSCPPAGAWQRPSTESPEPDQPSEYIEPAADIQAALTVLGRRPQREESRGA